MGRKVILVFKENNITRSTKFVRTRIITYIAFVRNTITHKNTFNRPGKKCRS
jgi:hypothetical protein